jgi:Zn-dependent peptidase ImmA (M78 family)
VSSEAEGRYAAERFRSEHGLGHQPLGDLVAMIEQAAGVDVAVLDAGPDEHGLTMRDPKRGRVFIGVARTTQPMRQRSTLAHELGHVLFEDWVDSNAGGWSDRSPIEVRADAFARHLLIPLRGLKEFLGRSRQIGPSVLSAVVQRFLVSPALAVIALEQAGYIDRPTKHMWKAATAPQLAVRFGWSDQYRALQVDSDQRRAPQRLLARAIRGYVEGVLSAQTIANLRGITPGVAAAELREAGIVPGAGDVTWTDATDLPAAEVDLAALDADLRNTDDPEDDGAGPNVP